MPAGAERPAGGRLAVCAPPLIRASIRPSPPFRGEREGSARVSAWEGEVGRAAVRSLGSPHLTPTLSAPKGGEGEIWRMT